MSRASPRRHRSLDAAKGQAKGAIGVVELEGALDHDWLRARFVEEGTWIRPFGDMVYLMPPFVIEPEDLERLSSAVVKVVGEWAERRA